VAASRIVVGLDDTLSVSRFNAKEDVSTFPLRCLSHELHGDEEKKSKQEQSIIVFI
jgi:hypothetical protein